MLSIGQMLGMRLRGTPIIPMRRCMGKLEAAGLSVPLDQLEGHALAGGNLEPVVDALVLSHREGAPAEWRTLSAVDLCGRDPVAAVRGTLTEAEFTFDRYSPADPEPIVGHARDRTPVRAACRVVYRPPLFQEATAQILERVQERLAARIAIGINTAESLRALEARKSEAEARLHALACDILPSVRAVAVTYGRVPGPLDA